MSCPYTNIHNSVCQCKNRCVMARVSVLMQGEGPLADLLAAAEDDEELRQLLEWADAAQDALLGEQARDGREAVGTSQVRGGGVGTDTWRRGNESGACQLKPRIA